VQTDFKHGLNTEKGKTERIETCRRLAQSSCTEAQMIIDMTDVVLQLCDQYPDDKKFAEIKNRATIARRNSYNLLGQLGEMADGDG